LEETLEKTLVLIKPDGVSRGLTGEIITRLEKRGLKLVAGKFMKVSQEFAETHYGEHKGKPFYDQLIRFITAAPVMAMVWEGQGAIEAVRQTMGSTHPGKAAPGTVRHDFGIVAERNLTHASDSPETAEREIALWFKPEEIVEWERSTDPWIYRGLL
jgi:nucleoside-diphosphate kinase